MQTGQIKLPPKLVPVFAPARGSVQYRALYGGRGSAKSYSAALIAAVWGYADPLRILCAREFQVSIAESFHAELKAAIVSVPWLQDHYDVGRDYLRGRNGTEFLFRGLRRNTQSIKSLAKIDLTIVEEAEDVPEESWLSLEATVFRQPKSELWAIWNPRTDGSPVDKRLRKAPPPNAIIQEINWQDNVFFPAGLETLRRREQERLDPNTYAHVWEGAYLSNSDRQVFGGKWSVADFTPGDDWQGPYQGGDFGFAQDPTAAVRCWIKDDCFYVEHEAGRVGLELDDTARFIIDRIPRFADYVTRWDSARPESISHIKRHGLQRSMAVKKWTGSVEDGIAFLRSFRQIIVHPRCTNVQRELRLYSHKVDRLTGDVLPDIVDADNHYIDAIRYAAEPMVKRRTTKSQELRF
ncbi:PBSX family phage terminase large subunit [Zhengella sp. ZM62]|uniref:PBSX family phage terminase large subunit n=1 Tax=Zhengella sedimenti TaxID=3390035 RepID=UPI003975DC89